ncbi:hypothetical protein CMV_026022 [Castanea mollissima]|uniref:Uncharacterized protein n=1 Tax=Castanea mollissima TaxID=60419 RepID=A0A8J4QKU6_9ROSI|nr:hypothetical protein CMV_026022 [Castanea mollissima]
MEEPSPTRRRTQHLGKATGQVTPKIQEAKTMSHMLKNEGGAATKPTMLLPSELVSGQAPSPLPAQVPAALYWTPSPIGHGVKFLRLTIALWKS